MAGESGPDPKVNPGDQLATGWGKAKDFIPVLWPILVTTVGAFYTLWDGSARDRASKVTMLNQREANELQARAAILKDLTNMAVRRDLPVADRLLALETMLYNSHSVFNGRSLLQELADDIDYCTKQDAGTKCAGDSERNEASIRLRGIASSIANIQKSMIRSSMDKVGQVRCAEVVAPPASYDAGYYAEEEGYVPDAGYAPYITLSATPIYCEAQYGTDIHAIVLCRMTKNAVGDPRDSIHVGMVVDEKGQFNPADLPNECSTRKAFDDACIRRSKDGISAAARDEFCGTFALSAYGMPFSDNVGLSDGHRVAVLLRELPNNPINQSDGGPLDHQIELIQFPDEFLPPGYQPTITVVDRMGNGK